MSSSTAVPALDRRAVGMLSFSHGCCDLFQGAVPALLPFLVLDRGYSYGAAGALVLAASLGGSLVQPLVGIHGDRIASPWLLPFGLVLCGLGLGLVGIVDRLVVALVAAAVGGLGVAAFHPEAARWASLASGERRATGMSVFSIGGNAGFALGPLLVTPIVLFWGLGATPVIALVPLAGALVAARALSRLEPRRAPVGETKRLAGSAAAARGAFVRLAALIGVQTGLSFALLAFVPLYLITALDSSKVVGNAAATVLLVAGALGTLIGGPLADRVGRRPVLVVPQLVLLPAVLAFPSQPLALAFLVLVVVGIAMDANFSTAVVLAQEYLPHRVGLASGVILGVSVGLGGLLSAGFGSLADRTGLETALYAAGALPVVALVLGLTLPEPHARPRLG